MRLFATCMECLRTYGVRDMQSFQDAITWVEFSDDGRYEITCDRGHQYLVLLQQKKFEVLFEIGANAILDGYYREAVSSFTASLERFCEFCIRVFMKQNTTSEQTLSIWKKVANQSERQLGAFIFLWTYCMGTEPWMLKDKLVSFRNNVVHKGQIPSRQEAVNYGKAVLEVIRPMMRVLKKQFPEDVKAVASDHLRAMKRSTDKVPSVTLTMNSILSLSRPVTDEKLPTFEEHLEEIKQVSSRFVRIEPTDQGN